MTDRYHSLLVILEKDIRDDDASSIMNAIRMLRGVSDVSGVTSNMESRMAETRARMDLGTKLWDVIYPQTK